MDRQSIFKDHARFYDLLYAWKDYRKESAAIRRLIRRYGHSTGNDLLEVACGTGKHTRHLKRDFAIVATDLNEGMLRIARRNCKGVEFRRADMISFDLGRQFDAVICLFSSIGYVRTNANLRKTVHNFSRHLKPGGVVIIEPWFTKSAYRVGGPSLTVYNGRDVKIARLFVSEARGNLSIMDMHYVVAEKDKRVRHYVDRHELGMFEPKAFLAYMREAGLMARFLHEGLMVDRGLYIGVKR